MIISNRRYMKNGSGLFDTTKNILTQAGTEIGTRVLEGATQRLDNILDKYFPTTNPDAVRIQDLVKRLNNKK